MRMLALSPPGPQDVAGCADGSLQQGRRCDEAARAGLAPLALCPREERGRGHRHTQGRPRGDPGGTTSARQRGAPGQTRRGETAAQTPSLQDEEGKSCRPSHAVWLPVVAAQRRSAAALTVTVEPPRGQRVHAREHEGGWKRASQGVTSVCSQSHRRRSRVCFSRPWL